MSSMEVEEQRDQWPGRWSHLKKILERRGPLTPPSFAPSNRSPGLPLLLEVAERTGRTVAAWQACGFVHGVLNTDNLNVTGESFDYGPWRFLPEYDPAFTTLNQISSVGALLMAISTLPLLINVVVTAFKGEIAGDNPSI